MTESLFYNKRTKWQTTTFYIIISSSHTQAIRETPRRCAIRASLVVVPLIAEISRVEVTVVIMVGQLRPLFKDQVLDLQVLWIQVSRHQVMLIEVLVSVLRARTIFLVCFFPRRLSQSAEGILYVRGLAIWPMIFHDIRMYQLNIVLSFSFALLRYLQ